MYYNYSYSIAIVIVVYMLVVYGLKLYSCRCVYGLNPPLGLFGLAMSPKMPAIGPNILRWPKRRPPIYHWVNFRPMPSMWHLPWVPLS